MAMTYQNFASLGVNLNRQKYGPLDISNVFTSEADLKYYLTKGTFTTGVSTYWYKNANEKIVPYPYEGQVLATVINGVVNVYALVADTFDTDGTTIKTFKTTEIGAKVEVDGKTIKLNSDGKLELVGLPTDIAGKTLVPSLVNGELTWAEPDTSTAEGQAQEIEGLKSRTTALEERVSAFLDNTGAATDVIDTLQEIINYIETHDDVEISEILASIQDIEGKLAGIDSTVTAYVETALQTLTNRVGALESKPFDTYAIKADVTTDISAAKTEAISAAKTETETQIAALTSTVSNTYATKQSVTDLHNAISATLNDYAKTADVDLELRKKANSVDVYTKEEVDNKIGTPGTPAVNDEEGNEITPAIQGTGVFASAYSRSEIDKLLDEVQGGSSASADSVLRQLNTYKSTNDERVKAVEEKNASQDTAIEAAQSQADKGVADAKTANDAIAALTNGAVATNTSEIESIKGKITSLETATGDHETRIVNTETQIASHEDAINALQSTVSNVYTKEEANAEFMTQIKVDDRINALIVAADPDGGKAITDIQNLVKYVEENAGEIAALITATSANTSKLAGINGTVTDYIDSVMPKESKEVTIAENGTLGLGEVSTDKLVQGTEVLILDGGTSAE